MGQIELLFYCLPAYSNAYVLVSVWPSIYTTSNATDWAHVLRCDAYAMNGRTSTEHKSNEIYISKTDTETLLSLTQLSSNQFDIFLVILLCLLLLLLRNALVPEENRIAHHSLLGWTGL